MGYRSDVAYVIGFGSMDERSTFIELVKHKNEEDMVAALDECDCEDKDRPLITFRCDDVKWYESYPIVKGHERLMRYSTEVFENTAGWRFVRVGEDNNDVEINEDGCTEIRVGDHCIELYEILNVERPQIEADF